MAKRGRPPKGKGLTIKSKEVQILIGFILLGTGIALFSSNSLAGFLPELLYKLFGSNVYLLGAIFASIGLNLIGLKSSFTKKRISGEILLLIVLAPLLAIVSTKERAGLFGQKIHYFLYNLTGTGLELVLLSVFLVLSLSIISEISITQFAEFTKKGLLLTYSILQYLAKILKKVFLWTINLVSKSKISFKSLENNETQKEEALIEIKTNTEYKQPTKPKQTVEPPAEKSIEDIELPDLDEPTENQPKIKINYGNDLLSGSPQESTIQVSELEKRFIELYTPKFEKWEYPPLDIFEPPTPDSIDKNEIQQKSKLIEQTLESFRIQARVTKIVIGPTVIQYALNLATGTKVSKVKNLDKDLSLALASSSGSIRIDTIAGTALVGIEVPRKKPHMVRIREILESEEMNRDKKILPLAIGKGIQGNTVVLDLASMPHMLVAGATGTGKSVTLNDILTGLLMKFSPDELKLILVDPKMVEMELYNEIPHLLVPVITEMDKVVSVLEWLITEMQLRYQLFKEKHVRSLAEFNEKSDYKIPYIILAIDEMADLILTKRNEVEQKIVRLAQLARATGIHLILATQRPSVNVITGLIKANIPARIALGVSSNIDSRVIIDQAGAENLLGKGDMLVKIPNSVKIQRVQGAFVSTKEIEKLSTTIKDYVYKVYDEPKTFYVEEVTAKQPEISGPGIHGAGASQDPLLRQAIELVLQQQRVSASAIQRYLRVGFNRAARLLDEMEAMGVISPRQGNKREILISSLDDIDL